MSISTIIPKSTPLRVGRMIMGDWYFSYDAVDRLMTATQTADTRTSTQYAGKYACWTYDSFGNRTLEAFSTVACSGTNPTPQAKAIYNQANNRIQSVSGTTSASFIYDASGNALYDGNNYYWYDAEGQLCAVQNAIGGTITQYVYDAEGARIAKGTLASAPGSYTATCAPPLGSGFSLATHWLVDQGGDQVTELNGSGVWQHSNIWAGGKLTATYDTKGIHYELADPLGTKRVQANALGQVDENCTSLPFGNDVGNPIGANCTLVANSLSTGDDATEHHFTQKERDLETGNDYFFARYYSSALGRFTTPDWSAKTTPVPYAVFADPQSLNLYAYVRNNPLTRVDADGHGGPCGFWCSISATYDKLAANFFHASEESTQKAAQQQQATVPVTVEQVQSDQPFGHSVIGIGGDRPVGLVPDSKTAAEEAAAIQAIELGNLGTPLPQPVPGKIEPVDPGKKIEKSVTIMVTPNQANAMRTFIHEASMHPQSYDFVFHNCAEFTQEVLHAGLVRTPVDLTPRGVVDDLKKQH